MQRLPFVDLTRIRGDYFAAMGIGLVRGRLFAEEDQREDSTAAIVNETAGKRFWPETDPIGKRFKANGIEAQPPWLEGGRVVGDGRKDGSANESRPRGYRPHATSP